MRFRFIEDRHADYRVTILCEVLGLVGRLLCLALAPGEPAIGRQS
jgi:hypothetical protein